MVTLIAYAAYDDAIHYRSSFKAGPNFIFSREIGAVGLNAKFQVFAITPGAPGRLFPVPIT